MTIINNKAKIMRLIKVVKTKKIPNNSTKLKFIRSYTSPNGLIATHQSQESMAAKLTPIA